MIDFVFFFQMFRVSIFVSIFIICLHRAVVCPPVNEIPKNSSETLDEVGGKDEVCRFGVGVLEKYILVLFVCSILVDK